MKKLLLFLLCGLSTLGLAVGGVMVSADETPNYDEWDENELTLETINDLQGKVIKQNSYTSYDALPVGNNIITTSTNGGIVCLYNETTQSTSLVLNPTHNYIEVYATGGTQQATNGDIFVFTDELTIQYKIGSSTQQDNSQNMGTLLTFLNNNFVELTPPPPPPPTIWEVIITAISGFFTSMFALLTGVFNGVSSVFWADNAPTILLQVIIFGAAAALVAAAVYVITKLIKNATAKLKGGVNSAKNNEKALKRERKKAQKHFKNLKRYKAKKERATRNYIKRHYKK